jgi:hypothetical protein
MRNRLMMLLVVTSALSGCAFGAKVPKATPIGAGCSAFEVIRPDRKDTLDTKRQVLAHNNTYRDLCPGAK